MAYSLIIKDQKIELRRRLTIGRADIPDDPLISREHIRFFLEKGTLRAQDLGSTNGIKYRGTKIAKGETITLEPGDVVQIGNTEIAIAMSGPLKKSIELPSLPRLPAVRFSQLTMGISCAITLECVLLLEPSMAYGRSIGPLHLALLSMMVLLPVVLFATITHRFLPNAKALFVAIVLVASGLTNYYVTVLADRAFKYGDVLVEEKIDYFCRLNFDHMKCVKEVNLCKPCALNLEKWKRDVMVTNLTTGSKPALK